MKILVLLCFILLYGHLCVIAQQEVNSTVLYDYRSRSTLRHITGNEQGEMLIVGNDGILLRSSDWGRTWKQSSDFPGYVWRNVIFFTANQCAIVGSSIQSNEFTAFYSSDAGKNWQKATTDGAIVAANATDFSSMEMQKTPVGRCYLCTTAGDIIRSDDMGKTWKKTADVDNKYSSLFNTLVAQGESLVYSFRESIWYKSSDGGETWKTMSTLIVEGNVISAFAQNNVLLLAVQQPKKKDIRIIESTDNGETWVSKPNDTTLTAINEVVIRDTQHILAMASEPDARIYRSTNGGQSWDTVASVGLNIQWESLFLSGKDSLLAIGDKKSIVAVNLKSRTTEVLSHVPGSRANFISSMQRLEDGSLFHTELETRRIVRSTDDGTTWQPGIPTTSTDLIADMYFMNGRKGFMQTWGNIGRMYETNDSGKTWVTKMEVKTSFIGGPLFSFADAATGVLEAENGAGIKGILNTKDSGKTWQEELDSRYSIRRPHLIRTDNGTFLSAVCFEKTFMCDTVVISYDMGKTWTRRPISDSLGIERVYAFNSSTMLALCKSRKKDTLQQGGIYRTTDGGITWVNTTPHRVLSPQTIAVENNVCIVGCADADSVFISSDRGITWSSWYFRPTKPLKELQYSLFQSHIHKGWYYATGRTTANFDPNPDTQRVPFILKFAVPSALTSVQEEEKTFIPPVVDVIPHPVRQSSEVRFSSGWTAPQMLHIAIYSLQGVVVRDGYFKTEMDSSTGMYSVNINAEGLSAGSYLLRIHNSHGTIARMINVLP